MWPMAADNALPIGVLLLDDVEALDAVGRVRWSAVGEGVSGFGMSQAAEQGYRIVEGHRFEEPRVGALNSGNRV